LKYGAPTYGTSSIAHLHAPCPLSPATTLENIMQIMRIIRTTFLSIYRR
jgi:hypothetical protein